MFVILKGYQVLMKFQSYSGFEFSKFSNVFNYSLNYSSRLLLTQNLRLWFSVSLNSYQHSF